MEKRKNEIVKRLADLEEEKKLLLGELSALDNKNNLISKEIGKAVVSSVPETPEDKISLFLVLFKCRKDVYPKLWENKAKGISGYSPACRNEWSKGICKKPEIKCAECANKNFFPFDKKAVRDHLEGKTAIGTYAINKDDTCVFLAADFDKTTWKEDVLEYKNAGLKMGIDIAIEKSRSGNGAHAWIFFSEYIPAFLARMLGTIILSYASSNRYSMSFESYDRFFPSQDFIPKNGFGNLIALPLQKDSREKGNTVFLDDKFSPYENQWEFLSRCKRLSEKEVRFVLEDNLPEKDGMDLYLSNEYDITEAERQIDPLYENLIEDSFKEVIQVEFGSKISMNINSIPPPMVSALKRTATFPNPKFFELQRMRFSTWNTPRYICCAELNNNKILLPRGTLDECLEIAKKAGAKININDVRLNIGNVDIHFKGKLSLDQENAVSEILKYENGLLVAPPGMGKTVMACAVIANRRVPTLVLVHRKQLVDQWKAHLSEFINIEEKKIGLLGGGRKKKSGIVDIAMLQTLSRMKSVHEIFSKYEQVVVDECHHIPAVSFETVLNESPARFFLGLTATPYRKDGHQAIIHMQCGPIRYEMHNKTEYNFHKKVIIKETTFTMQADSCQQPPIHEVWNELTTDKERNNQIAYDIKVSLEKGRFPLILSERKEHLSLLSEEIKNVTRGMDVKEFILIGEMGKKARQKVLVDIENALNNSSKPYILSTGSLIGEGFDLPKLDTLFLAMPFSYKGRIVQYAGRLHRNCEGKSEVIIYDYLDISSGLTISMFKKRVSTYKHMGYEIEANDNYKINQWAGQGRLF